MEGGGSAKLANSLKAGEDGRGAEGWKKGSACSIPGRLLTLWPA